MYFTYCLHKKPLHTDLELIELLKGNDQKAYNYLYDNYSAALYGMIKKMIGDRDEAGDILQEVFVKIWKNIDNYDGSKGRLFTWMINITRNTAIDFLRSGQSQRDKKTISLEAEPDIVGKEYSTHTNKEDHLGLNKVVESLKKEEKDIIDLAYYKGFTQKEIAKALDVPLGTVKTRARNAIIRLKNLLGTN